MRKTLIIVLLATLALCMFVGCKAEPEAANYDIKATVTGMTGDNASYNGIYYIKIDPVNPKGVSTCSVTYKTYTDPACTKIKDDVFFSLSSNKARLSGAVSFAEAKITTWIDSKPYEIKAGTYTGTLKRQEVTISSMTLEVLKDVTLAAGDA